MKLDELKTPLVSMTDDELLAHVAELRRMRRNFNRKTTDKIPEPVISLDYLKGLIEDEK